MLAVLGKKSLLKNRYKQLVIPSVPDSDNGPSTGEGDGSWYFDGEPVKDRQGWKLYISGTLLNFLEILETVRPLLRNQGVSYKYAASGKVLRKLNAGLYGYSQVGKLIVCYLEKGVDLDNLLHELMVALDPFRDTAPAVPFAQPVGGGFPLYYRYGAFIGDRIEINGQSIDDDRTMPASSLFAHLQNPLERFHLEEKKDPEFNRFLLRFPVYETIGQGGKGGIFAAFDTEADIFTDIILKIGYRNGQVLPDGEDGMDLIRHEQRFFKLLDQHGLSDIAPKLIDYAEFEHRNVLAMKRIEGENLAVLRASGELEVSDLEKCRELMNSVHRRGLYLGDAKLANFLRDNEGRIWAIDFECAGEKNSTKLDLLRTFHFSDIPLDDPYRIDRIHLLFSTLYELEEKDSFSESDRIIEIRKFIPVHKKETAVTTWAAEQLKLELQDI